MPNNKPLRLLFVINPISGGKEKINWEKGIQDYFNNSNQELDILKLNGNDAGTELKNKIADFRPDKVIAVGGDGTVKLVAGYIVHTNMVLGILPAGSANGMAKELKIPVELKQALEIIDTGLQKKIDVIQINDKDISIHLSDMGLNALLIKYFEQQEKRGMWGYAKVIFRVFRTKRMMRIEADINGEELVRAAFMIVIANARSYGTGAIINPEGDLADGKFEVVIVRRLTLFALFQMLISHTPFNADNIEVFHTAQVNITTHKENHFQVDGEYRGKTNAVRAKILPTSLNIMLPHDNNK